ncbi:hypothetical protein QE370_000371 [Aeromicrobium sp. SORGH_AS981]|nr:hypothetical protein [Aeromicrobium sp. SORGH_AS_0981]
MKSVGPTTNTNTARASASTMLVFDSHWMPRSMPETADRMNSTVSTVMMATRAILPGWSIQPLNCRPAPICRAPRPRLAAEPNSVAKMARMSMTRPAGPSARRPMSGRKAEEMSCERPLRKVP